MTMQPIGSAFILAYMYFCFTVCYQEELELNDPNWVPMALIQGYKVIKKVKLSLYLVQHHTEDVPGVNKMKYMRTYKAASAEESHYKYS
jgi:hypothetical protein